MLGGDAKLYAAYYYSGIWVVDPRRDSVLDSISVGGWWFGSVMKIALTQDDRRLYAAVMYGSPRGVHELDTGTDRVTRTVSLDPFRAVKLALSPNERRIFVTTQDNVPTSPSSNPLTDVPSWRIIQLLPRPRPAGEWRWDQAAVFHPNRKYIFVAHNRDVDVYLHRP